MFFVAMDWFNKVSRVFSRCLGSKWVENEIFGEKNKKPDFFYHHSGQFLGFSGDVLSANAGNTSFFLIIGERALSVPLNFFFKIRPALGSSLVGLRVGHCFIGQTLSLVY
jgi:hypothetical protein